MRDDLFEGFARDDLGLRPAPAAAVRRRGERLRRRRAALVAGGAALAVALVAVPVATLAGGGDDSAPPVTQTPVGPDRIPDDFPLDTGLPEVQGVGAVRIRVCGGGSWPAGAVARAGVVSSVDETTDVRELRIYPTAAQARSVVSTLQGILTTCRSEGAAVGATEPQTITPYDEAVGESAATWLRTDTSGRPVGEVVQVVQVGRAVLATQDLSELDLTSGPLTVPRRTALAQRLVPAMCVWSSSCPTPSAAPAEDLSDLGLDEGLNASDGDVTVDGPSATAAGAATELCGADIWPTTPGQRWAVSATGPEYGDLREVRVYPDASTAVSVLTDLRRQAAACAARGPNASGTVVRVVDAAVGYDSATWVVGYDGLGGEIVQVVRVGRAVLATVSRGEYFLGTIEDSVPDRTQLSRLLAPSLCRFTEAGC